ncbi:crotonase/enoyl-CoA hydratase family protein [Variovorax sp. KK3]|uniref:crotonase/enoyl-CoA hydratase family protein n=1 Tax=Variovorax sp. KK3 TaxID=1855728 RepID=UPI00097CBE89|nr:crotonase/enoyl-CoA hydratase family protein [Variovorax sp. KK3]
MTAPFVERSDEGAIAVLRLNRPETRNALGGADTIAALVDAIDELRRDPSVKVMVLTGNGPAFCAGGNLDEVRIAAEAARSAPADARRAFDEGIQRIPMAFERLEVPTIAAVNGPAMGAGCDLACMCDMRIAAQSASFAESFVKLGLVPGDGGAWLLPRVVGLAHAFELSLTGDAIDAAEALRIGLVSRVVEDDQLMPAALELARRIARHPGAAVRMGKRLILEGLHTRLDTSLQLSAALQVIAQQSPEHIELLARMKASTSRAPR